MAVLVRNTEKGPTVFADYASNISIEWQGAGDPSGNDIQPVPEAALQNVNFMKCIQRGLLVVEEASDEVKAILEKQNASWRARREERAQAATATIDPASNEDLITVPCIGPNNKGTGDCGEPVPVKEKTKDDRPALCPRHAALAPQYVMSESEELVDGKPQRKWSRATVTEREKQPQ